MASQIVISLLILTGCILPSCLAEEFPDCLHVDKDTFIMVVEDCASYIYCNGEDSFRDMCPDQTYFDAKAQECVFDDEGVCLREDKHSNDAPIVAAAAAASPAENEDKSKDTETETVEEATEDGEKTTEEINTTPAPVPSTASRPHCEPTVDSFHPHPERCEYYYSCISGYLTIVRCPYKYGWNYPTEQCKPLDETECYSV